MSRTPKKQPNTYTRVKRLSTTNMLTPVETVNSWDSAIAKARHKIARLKQDILTFQEMKTAGEAWPTQSERQTSESCHTV